MIKANALLEEAKVETSNLKEGEIFLVRDLFKGYIWKRIELRDRLLLGTLFLNYVQVNDIGVEAIEKTSSNQQKYIKRRK